MKPVCKPVNLINNWVELIFVKNWVMFTDVIVLNTSILLYGHNWFKQGPLGRRNQCDHMTEIKVALFFRNCQKRSHSCFEIVLTFFNYIKYWHFSKCPKNCRSLVKFQWIWATKNSPWRTLKAGNEQPYLLVPR